jgi:rod shape-determining protein MreC
MQFLPFLFEKHLDKTVAVIAAAASIFLLTLSEDNKIHTARTVTSFLLGPLDRVTSYLITIDELTLENTRLKKDLATLSHERERLLQLGAERNRLRELIGLKEDSFHEFLPCEVIARSTDRSHNFVVVDRGAEDGVSAGMAVVGYQGLVGRVKQVFSLSSNVLLLSNKSVSVSCVNRRSRVVGLLEWERENLFRLDYVGKEEDVQRGDTLVTSGLGMLFPKGFLVATVLQVTNEKGGLSKKIRAISMSDLNKLEELFIVTGSRGWERPTIYDEPADTLEGEGSRDSR